MSTEAPVTPCHFRIFKNRFARDVRLIRAAGTQGLRGLLILNLLLALSFLEPQTVQGQQTEYPPGTWKGTAPACDDVQCSGQQFPWCRAIADDRSKCMGTNMKLPSPGTFGNSCSWSGQKSWCASRFVFPQVMNFRRANAEGAWTSTCHDLDDASGMCGSGQFALCLSDDGDQCLATRVVNARKLNNFTDCSGSETYRAFCVDFDYLSVSIRNRWARNPCLIALDSNTELVCAPSVPNPRRSQWRVEGVGASQYVRIRNRDMPGLYLNIQNGPLVASEIRPGWWSAQWQLEKAPKGHYRLRNRWKKDQYINIQEGKLVSGPISPGWFSAQWLFEDPGADQ